MCVCTTKAYFEIKSKTLKLVNEKKKIKLIHLFTLLNRNIRLLC
jgi:hypothetical protein